MSDSIGRNFKWLLGSKRCSCPSISAFRTYWIDKWSSVLINYSHLCIQVRMFFFIIIFTICTTWHWCGNAVMSSVSSNNLQRDTHTHTHSPCTPPLQWDIIWKMKPTLQLHFNLYPITPTIIIFSSYVKLCQGLCGRTLALCHTVAVKMEEKYLYLPDRKMMFNSSV